MQKTKSENSNRHALCFISRNLLSNGSNINPLMFSSGNPPCPCQLKAVAAVCRVTLMPKIRASYVRLASSKTPDSPMTEPDSNARDGSASNTAPAACMAARAQWNRSRNGFQRRIGCAKSPRAPAGPARELHQPNLFGASARARGPCT